MSRRVVMLLVLGAIAILVAGALTVTVAAQAIRKLGSGSATASIRTTVAGLGDDGMVWLESGSAALGDEDEDKDDDEIAAEPGAVVIGVVRDGPAAEGGIVRGDIILGAGDGDVNDAHDLAVALEPHEPGDRLELRVRHGDSERTVAVTLGDRAGEPYLGLLVHPDGRGAVGLAFAKRLAGLELAELPFALRLEKVAALELPETVTRAAVVGTVVADTPAEKAGLEDGDLVTAIDGTPVEDGDALADAVAARKPGDTVVLTVVRPGEESTRDVTVTLGAKPGEPAKAYLGVRGLGMLAIERSGTGGAWRNYLRLPRLRHLLWDADDTEEAAPASADDSM